MTMDFPFLPFFTFFWFFYTSPVEAYCCSLFISESPPSDTRDVNPSSLLLIGSFACLLLVWGFSTFGSTFGA